MTETLKGPAAGYRVGDIVTTGDGAHWYIDRIDLGTFTAVPYDPTLPRWSQPGADPARDFAEFTAAAGAAGMSPLVRVYGESRGQALFLTLAGREYIGVPRTDGPGYDLDEVPDWGSAAEYRRG